jgi:hypothetical protein
MRKLLTLILLSCFLCVAATAPSQPLAIKRDNLFYRFTKSSRGASTHTQGKLLSPRLRAHASVTSRSPFLANLCVVVHAGTDPSDPSLGTASPPASVVHQTAILRSDVAL